MRKLPVTPVLTIATRASAETRFAFVIRSRYCSRDLPRILRWRKRLDLHGIVFCDNLGSILMAMIDHDLIHYEVYLRTRVDALTALPLDSKGFALVAKHS